MRWEVAVVGAGENRSWGQKKINGANIWFNFNSYFVGMSFISSDGRLIVEQFMYNTSTPCVWARSQERCSWCSPLLLHSIHNSFFPITPTGKRNLLNFPDRSVLALSSREILGTLTWNEHSNVHRGSFFSSVAKQVSLWQIGVWKNIRRAIWLNLRLINIHSLDWRG